MSYSVDNSTLINYDFVRVAEEENLLGSISSKFPLEEIPEEEDMFSTTIEESAVQTIL